MTWEKCFLYLLFNMMALHDKGQSVKIEYECHKGKNMSADMSVLYKECSDV